MARRKTQPPPKDEAPGAKGEDPGVTLDLTTDAQFLAFVEAQGGADLDPLSDEGLRLQSQYIKQIGDHPLDVLKTLSRNIFVKPSDRIAAAKTLLEYGARKVPAQFELSGKDGEPLRLESSMLSRLSAKELETLEKLLTKAQGA